MKKIDNSNLIYSFKSDMDFITKIEAGETISVKTHDCFCGQIKNESNTLSDIDNTKVNPATGPIFVKGAEAGDLLKIEIISIDLAEVGVSLLIPGAGNLGDKVKNPVTKILPVENGYVQFNDLSIPINPMIGVIGVAPGIEDGEWPTDTPWKHGGNMDTTDITEGSTLYLPVKQKGGLLALGDCHAIMGDGEVCVTGCEIGAEVTLKIDVIKGKTIIWPLLETSGYTMVISSGDTLEDATNNATDESIKHIQKALNMSWEDAYILTSLVVDFKISQVVNPKKTVRGAIPKYLISTESIINTN